MPVDTSLFDAPPAAVSTDPLDNLPLPFPLLLLVAIAAYVLLVVIALIIRQTLKSRGICLECGLFGREGEPCCPCCLAFADACNCCRIHSINGCLNAICPQRKTYDCSDILCCQGCAGRPGQEPLCGDCCPVHLTFGPPPPRGPPVARGPTGVGAIPRY